MADFVEGEDMTLKKNHPAGYNGITDGVIWQQLLLFFFPILFGTFFQQLYNTADAMIVGKFVGKEALSAVGGTTGTQSATLLPAESRKPDAVAGSECAGGTERPGGEMSTTGDDRWSGPLVACGG